MLEKLDVARRLFRIRMNLPLLRREGLWELLADVRVLELDDFLHDMGTQASGGDDRAKRLLAILGASGPPAQ